MKPNWLSNLKIKGRSVYKNALAVWNRLRARWRLFSWRRPRLAKWTRLLTISAIVLFLTGLAVALAVLLSVPSVRKLRQVQTQVPSDIYSADSILLGRYFTQYRQIVEYEDIPQPIVHGLIATEDERFFKHGGIDYRSWARVFFRTILKGDKSGGGGSTISQQLAKNLFPRQQFRVLSLLINKLREIAIAIRLERAYEKEELLTLYLNTVPFPENVYGIDVAAKRFFSKSLGDLTVDEGATLIGTLRATTYYNPVRFPERAQQRRNVVLNQMLKNAYLTQPEFDSLSQLPLQLQYDPVIHSDVIAPYFREYIRQEVATLLQEIRKPNGDPYDLYTDGLRVYTTLDSRLQQLAEEAIREHMSMLQDSFDLHWKWQKVWGSDEVILNFMRSSPRYQALRKQGLEEKEIQARFEEKVPMTIFTWEGNQEVEMSPMDSIKYYFSLLQIGFMAMEPNTGYIRAWVGGIDFDYFQYDHVRARRQAGSVFKPVVYTAALLNGIPPCEQIPNELIVFHQYEKGEWARKDPRREDPTPNITPDGKDEDDWIPQNSDGKYGGSYSMEGALTNSVNTVTVNLIMRTGVKQVVELARKLGINSEIPEEPSIALGSAEISLYEMVGAFGILASRGKQIRPLAVSRIETQDGKVLIRFDQGNPVQVISTDYADMMTKMLQSVATYGTASRLRWKYGLYELPIAGKTGTSQNHADGWFVGFTPTLVAGAWVGGDSPLVRFRNFRLGQGANTALPIWAGFMRKVQQDPDCTAYQGGGFPELSKELQQQLACPLRIKSPEELLADSLLQDSLLRLELEGLQIDSSGIFNQ